ncbi:hypothetical protein B0A81_13660 [Flavobacterium plurextorum]|uniref:Uncharacterized protein n=1 Tax=Flavobacterium plurextorum TaxID=1114867 RepID=A0ABX4CSL3_9FLAO|nr:hypothetical protein [Flavobacterium plurextorum]OXB06357.1 hypothetical protein B0A81_13660 [Flavobacterium plurextorum]
MEWNKFEPLKITTPDEIILSAINGFTEATKNLADMLLLEKSEQARINSKLYTNFQYELILHSKYINGYNFLLLEVGYDITIYPATIFLEIDIHDEINNTFTLEKKTTVIKDEEEFKKTLQLVFQTDRFKKLVSGVMKLASKELSDF